MTVTSPVSGPGMVTICVRNLVSETTTAEVAELFAAYGPVHGIRLSEDKFQHRFQRVGHVDVSSDVAARALAGLDGHLFKGAIIQLTQCSDDPASDDSSGDRSSGVRLVSASEEEARFGQSARQPYGVASVEKVLMVASHGGDDWFRYILKSGAASIVGYRQGTLDEVTAFAQGCADDFNLRNTVGWKSAAYRVRRA